jgi:putative flippase GtrA
MKTPKLFRYLVNSCVVTVLDIIIVWVLVRLFGVNIVAANTVGVIAGFLLDYFLSVFYVFESASGTNGFAIYLITFLFGLVLADALIYWSSVSIFAGCEADINLLLSKGVSIVIPFFILYYLRKILYSIKEKHDK